MTVGPDGDMWFLSRGAVEGVGRSTLTGQATGTCFEPVYDSFADLTFGPDGRPWFYWNNQDVGTYSAGGIGRFNADGSATNFDLNHEVVQGLAAGPDNELWFTTISERGEENNYMGAVDAITPTGVVSSYALPKALDPSAITWGPDGDLWFTTPYGVGSLGLGVGKLDPANGKLYYYRLDGLAKAGVAKGCLRSNLGGQHIVVGPDHALWLDVDWDARAGARSCTGLVRITTDTVGSSTPVAPTMSVVHPIVIPRIENHALGLAKVAAQVEKGLIQVTDFNLTAVKIGMSIAYPEVAVDLLMPNGADAAEYLYEKWLDKFIADPPDPHFDRIARPAYSASPGIRAHKPLTRREARAWNQLMRDTRMTTSYLQAMVISVERLRGAAAGKCTLARRKDQAASRQAKTASIYLAKKPHDLRALRHALTAGHAPDLSLTANQFKLQAYVAAHGVPTPITAALRRAGLKSADISQITALMIALKPAAVSLFHALDRLASGVPRLSKTVRGFAAISARPIRCNPHQRKKHHHKTHHR